jgi:hypothetical protein
VSVTTGSHDILTGAEPDDAESVDFVVNIRVAVVLDGRSMVRGYRSDEADDVDLSLGSRVDLFREVSQAQRANLLSEQVAPSPEVLDVHGWPPTDDQRQNQEQQGPTYWTKVHLGSGIQPARVKEAK